MKEQTNSLRKLVYHKRPSILENWGLQCSNSGIDKRWQKPEQCFMGDCHTIGIWQWFLAEAGGVTPSSDWELSSPKVMVSSRIGNSAGEWLKVTERTYTLANMRLHWGQKNCLGSKVKWRKEERRSKSAGLGVSVEVGRGKTGSGICIPRGLIISRVQGNGKVWLPKDNRVD